MSVLPTLHDIGAVILTKNNVIQDPGTGNTFNQNGMAYGTATVGVGTYKMPDDGLPMYVHATGAVTIQSQLAATVASLASGTVTLLFPLTATTWAIGSSGSASAISIADAGEYTSETTVEGALQSIMRDVQRIDIPIDAGWILAAGTPMAAFADNASPNPGITLANSEAVGIRWNNNATQNAPIWRAVALPPGLASVEMNLFVVASKTGATSGDATTFTVTVFENEVGALHDAGSSIGGVTSAMTGAATAKTVQSVFVTLAALSANGVERTISISITPTSGTLGTDDVIIHKMYLTYKRS